jgi:hypothetical protein
VIGSNESFESCDDINRLAADQPRRPAFMQSGPAICDKLSCLSLCLGSFSVRVALRGQPPRNKVLCAHLGLQTAILVSAYGLDVMTMYRTHECLIVERRRTCHMSNMSN